MTNGQNGRRRMWGKDQNEIHARRSQATDDALRRRQKLKKSHVVKRHVFYKQKRHLLNQLDASERDKGAPIIAQELGVPGEAIEFSKDLKQPVPEEGRSALENENTKCEPEHACILRRLESDSSNEGKQSSICKESKPISKNTCDADCCEIINSQLTKNIADEVEEVDEVVAVNVGQESSDELHKNSHMEKISLGGNNERAISSAQNYGPFLKQRKEYEEHKKHQEEQRRQWEEEIKQREKMLSESRKRRKRQSKQHRKKTKQGQPKLGHRVESLLARMGRQIQDKK